MKISHVLVGSASAIALSCSAFAFAQEAEAPAPQERESAVSRVLQTVTVSATKKSDVEDVQSVPVSVTAYNSDTLDALNVRDLESLSYSSPNVSLDDAGTSRGTANFAIRGLGVNSSIPSIDPAVGVFVDGVYMGLNSGLVLDLFDMESVEVLRGPQGLLFGRNTTGGAVLITTSNPTDDFTARARVTYETPIDDDRGAGNTIIQGIVSGPLIEGRLNGKLSVFYNGDEGYFQNLANGENHGEAQSYIVRGALDWFPTDYISNLFKIQYGDGRSDGPSGQNRGLFERDTFDFSINYPGFATSENTFISNQTTVDVDFGNGTITNIFGYRSLNNTTGGDIDSTPLTLFHSDTELEAEQISNELRYNGRFGDIDLTTGLFYFELVTANIGLIDAEYTSVDFDISGDGVVSAADLDLAIPRVPELTYGFGFIYDHDLGSNGALVTRVNFQHKDEFAYTDNNFGWIQEYDALSANVSWETPWDGISMSVFGDNLLDQVSAGNDTQLPFGSNVAPFVPGGEALGNGVNAPFDQYPAVGTLSPLKRGRVVGIELTYDY